MRAPLLLTGLSLIAVHVGACAPPAAPPEALPAARLPSTEGAFAPSRLSVETEHPLSVDTLTDTATCAGCHPKQAAEWSRSAHGFASFDNPWYRESVDALVDDAGHEATKHCAGCHDLAPLLAGRMEEGVKPEDPLAYAGVTCLGCHGASSATSEGTGSLVLSGLVPLPLPGDEPSLLAHKAAMGRDVLTSPLLCASCHRGILGPGTGNPDRLVGQDDAGGWKGSAWAGSTGNVLEEAVAPKTCAACHMAQQEVDGVKYHSHTFPGGQTALAGASGDTQWLTAIQETLRQAATLDLGVWADGALVSAEAVPAGTRELSLDAVVRNVGAGHTLPGGPRDTQDIWIAVELTTARGEVLLSSGAEPDDPDALRIDAGALNEQGERELAHRTARIRASAWDRGVPARQARAFRYTVELPEDLEAGDWPLKVAAKLVHQRHASGMQQATCADQRTPRGQAFLAEGEALGRPSIDGCAPIPVTVMAEAGLELGPGAGAETGGSDRDPWDRAFDHTLALSVQLSESLTEAEAALERLRPLASTDLQRAQVLWLEAVICGRQGRVDEAVAAAKEARALIGPHPALSRAEGRALAAVWRWDEAAVALAEVTRLSPGDTAGWRELAVASQSAGHPRDALTAAQEGLKLAPHDPDLLRVQALALDALDAPDAEVAREVWLSFRGPDQAADLALTCEQEVEGCARSRSPVPEWVGR